MSQSQEIIKIYLYPRLNPSVLVGPNVFVDLNCLCSNELHNDSIHNVRGLRAPIDSNDLKRLCARGLKRKCVQLKQIQYKEREKLSLKAGLG